MNSRTTTLLSLFIALLAFWAAWQIYSGWGLVTLDVHNAPVGKVLDSIHRQGGIVIASNLDPETRVTIQVDRVPPLEALDTVAVRTGASWRLAYLGAQNMAAIDAALAEFRAGRETPGWQAHGSRAFGLLQPQSGVPLDLRRVEWKPGGRGGLHDLLESAAEETGVYLAAPVEWQPQVTEPHGGKIAAAAPDLFRRAGGVSREVFLLRKSENRDSEDGNEQARRRGSAWIGASPQGGGTPGRGGFGNPERMAAMAEAQIKLLPPAEQQQAHDDLKAMRDFWQSVRDLPQDERREKMHEFFNRPEVQERLDQRRLAREAKMTPDQRIERSKSYWDRKAAAKYRSEGSQ